MARRYSRQDFLTRLRLEIEHGRPLVMASAGNGIAGKFIERGGVRYPRRLQHGVLPHARVWIACGNAAYG